MATYKRIKSVELAMDIMKFLAQEIQPVSGKEVALALKEPHGTIMCHLATLEKGGFVRRVYERYEIGVYLATIRASVKRSRELTIEQARHDLDRLSE